MEKKSKMSQLEKNRHMLSVLLAAKPKLRREILKHCDDSVIHFIHEALHNLLSGNIPINEKNLNKLKKHKTSLRTLYSKCNKNKCMKKKRQFFVNQAGGHPLVLALSTVGQFVLPYLAEKLASYAAEKISQK